MLARMTISTQLQEAASKEKSFTATELRAALDKIESNIKRDGSKYWSVPAHREAGEEMLSAVRERLGL